MDLLRGPSGIVQLKEQSEMLLYLDSVAFCGYFLRPPRGFFIESFNFFNFRFLFLKSLTLLGSASQENLITQEALTLDAKENLKREEEREREKKKERERKKE